MAHFNLKGLGVALVTPFNEDFSIDYKALEAIILNIMAGKADFIVVMGTTGETPTLTASEAKEISEFVISVTQGKIPLVLGMGGNCTVALCQRLKTEDLSGYSAILSVCPYYNKPNQEGMYRHFKAVAEASPLPVILYNVPGRTGVNLLPQTVIRLACECENIIGIKEASGSVAAVTEIVAGKPDSFEVVSGDDALTLPMIAVGATGVISVIGNALPAEFADLVHAAARGEFEYAKSIHRCFKPLYKLMFAEGNPAGIKCALSQLGYCHEVLRLPLVKVGNICRNQIKQALTDFRQALTE
ncbi:MAG: 4-hydroxy-tetrahydrodipicolinate synthase [Prevotella sp.]|nr:4-hydroxy-tetrahydrodipicolinate synthase [Prevotella sp.]MCM1074298.1 4-hydroxy-tetrahydrodipicolinate synthase [Ruminococcus sp.]